MDLLIQDDRTMSFYNRFPKEAEKTSESIISDLASRCERYEAIADLWHQLPEKISLKEWASSNKILLLGRHTEATTQMAALNQVIVTRLMQILLNGPNIQQAESFIILDELGSLNHLQGLLELATEGRKKGVSLTLGFQSYAHIKRNYTQNEASAILGQIAHKAILRLDDYDTAMWAEQLFGYEQGWSKSRRIPTSKYNEPVEITEHETSKPVHEADKFQKMPAARLDLGDPLHGIYLNNGNSYTLAQPADVLLDALIPLENQNTLSIQDDNFYGLTPWMHSCEERLGLNLPVDDTIHRITEELEAESESQDYSDDEDSFILDVDDNDFEEHNHYEHETPAERLKRVLELRRLEREEQPTTTEFSGTLEKLCQYMQNEIKEHALSECPDDES